MRHYCSVLHHLFIQNKREQLEIVVHWYGTGCVAVVVDLVGRAAPFDEHLEAAESTCEQSTVSTTVDQQNRR